MTEHFALLLKGFSQDFKKFLLGNPIFPEKFIRYLRYFYNRGINFRRRRKEFFIDAPNNFWLAVSFNRKREKRLFRSEKFIRYLRYFYNRGINFRRRRKEFFIDAPNNFWLAVSFNRKREKRLFPIFY